MQKHKNHKANGNGKQSVQVEFKDPNAKAVAIAGSFNSWQPEATRMLRAGDGRWVTELFLQPGTYEYLFVADGRWVPDPLGKETVPNPFGGVNCLLRVASA